MRCPECSQRNSVAAKKCAACGGSLRRKTMPLSNKVVLGSLIAVGLVVSAAALSNALIDPEKALTNTATKLTSKATSAKEMMGNIKNFDSAMRRFLEKFGTLENNALTNKLSFCLPKSLYEARVFDLLPNLKLVEVDTALNASPYLILLNNGKTEVLPIIGLDVYDSNSFLPQSNKTDSNKKTNDGQLLVLLGHSTDIHGHHPRVKVLLLSSTLQSDNIVDLSDKVVPKLYGEGSAKFSPNQKDIELSISLHSRGEELNAFAVNQLQSSLPVADESLYEQLIWQNNAYALRSQSGVSKLSALFAVACSLKNHNKLAQFSNISAGAKRTIEQNPAITDSNGFTLASSRSGKRFSAKNVYELRNDSCKVIVELRPNAVSRRGGISWMANSLSISRFKPSATAASAPIPKATEVINNSKSQAPQTQVLPPVIQPATENKKAIEPPVQEKPAPAKEEKEQTQSKATTSTVSEVSKPITSLTPTAGISVVSSARNIIKLRSGPSTSQSSIYDIKPNSPITIIGKDNGWYKIKVNDKEGYIYAGLINAGKAGGYTSKTTKQAGSLKDEAKNVIGFTRTGEHLVVVSGLKNNRYKVILSNGKTGYVYKDIIDGAPSNSQPPSVP